MLLFPDIGEAKKRQSVTATARHLDNLIILHWLTGNEALTGPPVLSHMVERAPSPSGFSLVYHQ